MVGELIFESIVFIVSIFLYVVSTQMQIINPIPVMRPNWWPQIILIIMIIVDIPLIYGTAKKLKNSPKERVIGYAKVWLWLIAEIINMVIFIILLNILGFLISAFLFALISSIIIDGKFRTVHPFVSLLVSFGLTLFFGSFLSLALPRGLSIFRDLSFWLY